MSKEEIMIEKVSYADLQNKLIECNTDRIILQQENQQLKENIKDLDNQKEMMFKNMQLNQLKVCELAKVLDEIREYINNYDVFKEFSFPLMKRDEENQVKSSIDYEFQTSIKKSLLQILDKVKE